MALKALRQSSISEEMNLIYYSSMIQFNEDKQNKEVDELHNRGEEELAQLIARQHNLDYSDLASIPINMDALRLVNEKKAREARLAVFNAVDKNIDVAVAAPENVETKKEIEELRSLGYNISQVVVSMR